MNIIFTADYLGRETAMKQYKKGETWVDCPSHVAQALFDLGVAKEQKEETKKPIKLVKEDE